MIYSYFNLFNIVLYRSLDDEENGLGKLNIKISEEALCYVSEYAGGDIRNALNALEIAVLLAEKDKNALITIDLEIAKQTIQTRYIKYDRTGDEHYHLISALIKSILKQLEGVFSKIILLPFFFAF